MVSFPDGFIENPKIKEKIRFRALSVYINLYLVSPFSVSKETHPLSYLQTEVGCLTFLLARKHIPSATCRQKLAALPSYWPGTHIPSATCRQKLAALPSCWLGNTSPLLPADISWLSYSAIHKAAGSLVTGRSQKYWWQE